MAERDPIEHRETTADTHLTDANRNDDTDSPPRWVKVFGIIVIVLVLLIVILHLTGYSLGGHTP